MKVMCCVHCGSVKIIVPPFCSPSGGHCVPPSFVGVVPQVTHLDGGALRNAFRAFSPHMFVWSFVEQTLI